MDTATTHIKGYEIQERIGTGGFGAVYRAYQTTVGREVAIKVILPSLANRPEFIRRFETEAQLIARLEHLHIVPLHDYWRDPDGAYLVMRYLRGGSLRDAIAKAAYDVETAALLLDQISSGLAAAHRSNIIHRDLKPGNVLLDEDGNAYLADFGIAKDLALAEGSITQPNELIGSPDYLAPEQARSEPVTPQTDIYSLGVVLYEMLTGEHPYPGLNAIERLYKHLNEPVPPITSLDPKVGDAINAVIQKATAKNPAYRFADVLAMAAAFREAAALTPTHAGDRLVELLTPREQEILQLIINGKSNREIAKTLVVELTTVKWYITQIYQKLNVRSRVQAIVRARELNLIVGDRVADTPVTFSILPEPQNPYKGLSAFEAADEQDFFGREKITQRLIKRLGEKDPFARFLAVIGPSGSGKSSLVKAGLTPALWRGEHPGSDCWYIVEMTPGEHPLDELEVALTRIAAGSTANLREQLERDERGLTRAAQILLPDDGSDLLLVIDQFEEVFTLVSDEAQRQHFLDLLYAAVTDLRSRVRVVVSLRADFYDRPLQYPGFGELVRSRMETILPMSAEELERAISQPAERAGISFEEGLVATIVADIHYQPGGLPLLQYALTELFESREGRVLNLETYRRIGGAVGALAKRAEDLYSELAEAGQQAARQMFLRLVTPGEGMEDTRRRVPRSELISLVGDADVMDEVIDTFAAYRLLALDHDPGTRSPTVEVAHEALLREWARLRGWLEESRSDIRLERQLAAAAAEWADDGRDASFLLRGARLNQFQAWRAVTDVALTPLEREYLAASNARRGEEQAAEAARQAREARLEQRSRTVLRALVGVFAVAALISGGLALWANSQRVRAEEAEQDAETAEQEALRQASMGLAAQARLETLEGQPERAVLLALEALEGGYPYTWQAERALFAAVTENRLLHILEGHTQPSRQIEWSPDSSRLVSASGDGSAIIWDAATGKSLFTLQHEARVNDAKWSPDGTRVATASFDGTAAIWDAATGERLHVMRGPEAEVWRVNWSPDGMRVVTGGGDGPGRNGAARVWDATTGRQLLALSGHTDLVADATWSPDGTRIATGSYSTARIWDAETGEALFVLTGHTGWVQGVPWSPDGTRLVTHADDGQTIVWNAETGEQVFTLPGEGRGGIPDAVWSLDGTRLLTMEHGSNQVDGVAAIWDMSTGEQIHRLSVPGMNDLRRGVWSPDGRRVAVHDEVYFTRIWDAETGNQLFTVRVASIQALAWSPDGRQLATGSDNQVLLWNMESLSLLEFAGQNSSTQDWSPDGRTIVRADASGPPVIVNSETGETVRTLPVLESAYISAVWSPDGARMVTTQEDGTIRMWDSRSGQQQWATQVEAQPIFLFDPDWSPDGTQIAVGGAFSGPAFAFDAESGRLLQTFDPGEVAYLPPLRWSHDGTRLAAAADPGTMSDSDPGRLFIWDAASGKEIWSIPFGDVTTAVDWSPDDRRLLVTTFGLQYILDAETGAILQTYVGNTGADAGRWSPDGQRVATFGGTVRIWDPNTGGEYAVIDVVAWAGQWSPDGTRLITFAPEGTLRVWRVFPNTQSLIEYAHACCVLRELTAEERTLFGLPQRAAPTDESSTEPGQSRLPTALSVALSLVSGALALVGSHRLRKYG